MLTRSPFSSRTLLPRAPEMTSASFAPATRYRCAANRATSTSTASVARTSSVTVSVISNPFFLCETAQAVSWRRKGADGHRHAVHAKDFDLAAARDRRLRRRRQRLNGAVVREHDRAVPAFADAHDDPSLSADEIAQVRRLVPLSPPQRGEDRECHAGAERAERQRHRGPAGGTKTERDGAKETADAEHREKAKKHGHSRRIVRPRGAEKRNTHVRNSNRRVKAHVHASADARKEKKRRAEHGRAGEDQLECVGAHRIASFPEELLPAPIVLRVKQLIRRNGNPFPRCGRNFLVHTATDV